LRRVVLRAIEIAPSARYPSMDALLAELAVDPYRRRKRVLLGVGAAAAIGGAIAATSLVQGSQAADKPPELCTGATRRLAGVWDAQARTTLETAFGNTKNDLARSSFVATAKALDVYATSWEATTTDNCEATRLRGEQTEEVLTLRQACLDQRLEELRALVRVLGDSPSRAVIEKGDRSVSELEPIARCNNIAILREPGLPPPELAPKLLEIQRLAAEAKADIIVGRYLPALNLARQATELSAKVPWAPARAEAEALRGTALMVLGNYEESSKAYVDATWAAFEGKRDDMIAGAAMSVATVYASGLGKPAEARIWLALADAALARAGTDKQRELRITQVRGIVLSESGDLLAASKAHADAYKLACELYGRDSPTMFADEGMYATTLTKAFQFKTAVDHFDHAIALRSKTVGGDHPDVAMLLSNEGISLRRVPDTKRAHEVFARALAIREKSYGKSSPLLVPTLDNYAELLNQEGRYDEALAVITRALSLAEIIPGKQHPTWHQVATTYGEILTRAGKHAQARAIFDEVFALERASHSAVLPTTESARALLALAEKAWADAETHAKASVEHFEGLGGKDNPELVTPLTSLGRARLELHDDDGAKVALRRAEAIAKRTQLSADELAPLHAALARLR
jgi:eukaryotic-like serine/threonine-protein kinase